MQQQEMPRLLQHLIALVIGGLVGAFFSDMLRRFRKWIFFALLAIGLLGLAFMSTITGNLAFFIAGAIAAYFALMDRIARALGKGPRSLDLRLGRMGRPRSPSKAQPHRRGRLRPGRLSKRQ